MRRAATIALWIAVVVLALLALTGYLADLRAPSLGYLNNDPALVGAAQPVEPTPVPVEPTPVLVLTDTPAPVVAAGVECLPVGPAKIANIAQGLTVTGGGTLGAATARAVRSSDYQQVYFIAAEIEGAGMEGPGQVGVWAANDLAPGQGLIFAVGGMANEFSDWGDGADTDAQISLSSAGAQVAQDCVRALQP